MNYIYLILGKSTKAQCTLDNALNVLVASRPFYSNLALVVLSGKWLVNS